VLFVETKSKGIKMKLAKSVTLDSEFAKWFGEGHWWNFSLTLFWTVTFWSSWQIWKGYDLLYLTIES